MYKYQLTIGLNDKNTEKQEIKTADAKSIISNVLINNYDIFAFTMIDCYGVYKMNSTGAIIQEASIRIEIASDDDLNAIYPAENIQNANGDKLTVLNAMINELKYILNQESIMIETSESEINFR